MRDVVGGFGERHQRLDQRRGMAAGLECRSELVHGQQRLQRRIVVHTPHGQQASHALRRGPGRFENVDQLAKADVLHLLSPSILFLAAIYIIITLK